jgi:hypothetical protein
MMLFEADDKGQARWPMPIFYAQQMMMLDWGAPANQPHDLFKARTSLIDSKGRPIVVAYPLRGPDGRWAVMMINRDRHAHRVHISLQGSAGGEQPLSAGMIKITQYSSADYRWLDIGENSHPAKDLPPEHFLVPGDRAISLPAYSLTVVSEPLAVAH